MVSEVAGNKFGLDVMDWSEFKYESVAAEVVAFVVVEESCNLVNNEEECDCIIRAVVWVVRCMVVVGAVLVWKEDTNNGAVMAMVMMTIRRSIVIAEPLTRRRMYDIMIAVNTSVSAR